MRSKRNPLAALLALGVCVAAAAAVAPIREIDWDARGEINWSTQALRATGSGVRPPDAASPAQARQMAKRAAVADAYRNLAQLIEEVHVTSDTTVKRLITSDDTIRLSVQAYVRGARVVKENEDRDGTYNVTLQVGMAGKQGLTGILLPHLLPPASGAPAAGADAHPDRPAPDAAPQPSVGASGELPALLEPELMTPAHARGPFTSVIVDARGFDVQPALAPRIYDSAGTELYGTMRMDPEYAEEVGIAGYMGTIRAAKETPRAGRRPLVVRAIGAPDVFRRCVALGEADAERVLAEDHRSRFLRRCAVIFVVDERRARDEAQ